MQLYLPRHIPGAASPVMQAYEAMSLLLTQSLTEQLLPSQSRSKHPPRTPDYARSPVCLNWVLLG